MMTIRCILGCLLFSTMAFATTVEESTNVKASLEAQIAEPTSQYRWTMHKLGGDFFFPLIEETTSNGTKKGLFLPEKLSGSPDRSPILFFHNSIEEAIGAEGIRVIKLKAINEYNVKIIVTFKENGEFVSMHRREGSR